MKKHGKLACHIRVLLVPRTATNWRKQKMHRKYPPVWRTWNQSDRGRAQTLGDLIEAAAWRIWNQPARGRAYTLGDLIVVWRGLVKLQFFQIFTMHFHLLARPLNKEFFIKSHTHTHTHTHTLYLHPLPIKFLKFAKRIKWKYIIRDIKCK